MCMCVRSIKHWCVRGHPTNLALGVLSEDCLQHALRCTLPISMHIMTVSHMPFGCMKYLFIILHGLTNGSIERKEKWGWEGRKGIREVCKSPGGLGPNEEGGRVQGVEEGSTAVQQKTGVLEGGRVALTH